MRPKLSLPAFAIFALLMLALASAASAAEPLDLAPFLRQDAFGRIRISPTGTHYAATVPLADRTVLVVIRRADQAITAKVTGGAESDIADFWWVNDSRLVVAMAARVGRLEAPVPTGELNAVDADGSRPKRLMAGARKSSDPSAVTFEFRERRFATIVDTLRDDAQKVLVAVEPQTVEPRTYIEKVDVYTGAHGVVARAPVRRAQFAIDAAGVVRFAQGLGSDNASKLYTRDGNDSEWRLLNDETASGRVETPLGFSADGRIAYLRVEQASGPDAIVALDTASGTRTEALRDARVDPYYMLRDARGAAVGAAFLSDRLRVRFFDETAPVAVRQRSLEKSFPGAAVEVTSSTDDGRLSLVRVGSDRNPGDYYLYDADTLHADLVFQRSRWFEPERMAATEAVDITARDGLVLQGYLVRPAGATGALPLLVVPHGGPFGVFDAWGFDPEVEMLAQAGYAVLRVNYRGSGNRGRAFLQAGAREWGRRMQDDVTDATRWAIAQGIADPARICLYGGSYGAYAALMGVAREPGLYRCAVGYVGVYDLPLLVSQDASQAKWLRTWYDDWVGPRDTLAAVSPSLLAAQIKAPVLLAAGGADLRAPIAHTQEMEKALVQAGVPVESLYFPNEGHGFYAESHRREFYTRLLGFLARHLGGRPAQ
jgi:dipeptidyl aminopeptidase/acylaminoacyl peptidase